MASFPNIGHTVYYVRYKILSTEYMENQENDCWERWETMNKFIKGPRKGTKGQDAVSR